ncbi:hypothetical protein BC835DRAFT_831489 [Cytidiella melzeri]|nr:hypothetical protein BC835DRAFT_831489 [Cytidiella melzeri]
MNLRAWYAFSSEQLFSFFLHVVFLCLSAATVERREIIVELVCTATVEKSCNCMWFAGASAHHGNTREYRVATEPSLVTEMKCSRAKKHVGKR